MAEKVVTLPCDIGDKVYDICVDWRWKEVSFDEYIVEDISLKAVQFCEEWIDKGDRVGKTMFFNKEEADEAFKNMMCSDKFKDYKFFYNDVEVKK